MGRRQMVCGRVVHYGTNTRMLSGFTLVCLNQAASATMEGDWYGRTFDFLGRWWSSTANGFAVCHGAEH